MKLKPCIYSQPNYLSRTAIEVLHAVRQSRTSSQILFAVCLSKKQALTGGKSLAREDKCSKKIGAVLVQQADRRSLEASAVLNFVFFVMLKNKIEQSAKRKLLLNSPTDRTFENRWSRYKEPSKNKAEAYLVYVEHLFLCSDAGDARIFSKEEDVYGIDYGFGLDAPKETEETHPENLFAYRRNYTWNEKNLLTKSSDRSYTVHYRYGEDGQRALKYTEEGRSETLYFNNFYTIHIPVQDKNNPQGLRVHKHIFVGNSRLVTAMTHTDNNGDNAEQREKRYYYHSDHLGSAQFVTDWRGRQYEHIEYTPYGELWIEEVAAGLDKLPFRFTGKEMDEETGLYYYGARYLDPKYSRWLSGDPALNDYIPKAPIDDEAKKHNENLPGMGGVYNIVNMHLYHYAGNNPIKYEDPDGKIVIVPAIVWGINATLFGYGVVASRNDEIGFAARHPIIAVQLGLPKDGGRHGINSAASNFAINSGLSKFAFTGASQDLGSKKGAYRHAVWQAIICSKFGENIATEVGNSHETVSPEKQASYTSLIDADTYCDQMNNIIGRSLGKDSNLSNKELALKALDIFHDSGLYTVSQNKDGSYSVGITKINDSEYNTAYSEILKRNNQGLLE